MIVMNSRIAECRTAYQSGDRIEIYMPGLFHRSRALLIAGCAVLVAAAAWRLWRGPPTVVASLQIARARRALQVDDFQQAEELAASVRRDDELWSSAQLLAGEAASLAGRLDAAYQYYAAIPRDGSPDSVRAAFLRGDLARDLGRLSQAEPEYEYILDQAAGDQPEPERILAHERLAFLFGVTGRRWQSLPHWLAVVRSGLANWDQLAAVGDLEHPQEGGEFLRDCARKTPDDVLVQLGLAVESLTAGNAQEARRLLQNVADQAPHLVAAQALLGELLVGVDDSAFIEWNSRLSPDAKDFPEIWFVRGLAARRRGNLPVAARCFWEALRLAPAHRRACYLLSQVLVSLGRPEADEFSERAARLLELAGALNDVVRSQARDEKALKRTMELLETTGRTLEASAWAGFARRTFPQAAWPKSALARLAPQLNHDTPQTDDAANLALKHDLSGYPPYEELLAQMTLAKPQAPAARHRSIRFEEAADVGLNFVYCNGYVPSRPGTCMFELTGGGVAVLDFDADGWPDLFLAQGTEWPLGSAEPVPTGRFVDCLYRNFEGRSFVDVTQQAGLIDGGFGQGCTVGDFDNDGFPDLYVAHIGRNQLLHNNGDGTFSDVTKAGGIEGRDWTVSCVIVDLNADGSPDLFDVTYLTGPHVFEVICEGGRTCTPKMFDGIPDRLRLSRGDGTFELVPHATPELNSKGLAVVAFDLFDRGRPCLFVANDQVPGFLLRNHATDDRYQVRFEDVGFASGLALNGDGQALAGMGIAADDVNGDGRIDFFETTFKNEPKILYMQEAPGLFVDATSTSGLRVPGMALLGWGAQFLDADCDGEPDLVTVNGHVDKYRGEYEMRPQLFQNSGGGHFVELTAREAGGYFERKFVARGLARIDWNRDGRMDFVVTNIGSPPSLLTNQTIDAGAFLNVRLHATKSARDAIGSVVEIVMESRRWTKQLMAGDGYMASNERVVQFGLADASLVSEMLVHWPSGATTVLRNLPVNVTIELVEGAKQGLIFRGMQSESVEVASPADAADQSARP
jgi:tetratricopeptide (TPR) repeat protein